MKLIRNLGLGAFVAVLGFTLIATPAYAHTEAEAARCAKAEARIKVQSGAIQTLRETRIKAYTNVLDRTDTLIESAKSNGYATQKLETARSTTQTALDSYTTNATNFEAALTSAQEEACGHSEGAFVNAMATSRTNLVTLRASSTALKSTVVTQLVPEIKAYAAWLKEQASVPFDPSSTEEAN